MIGKIIFTIFTVLVAMLILRQFSAKPAKQKARIRQKPGSSDKSEHLVWDEETNSYRVER